MTENKQLPIESITCWLHTFVSIFKQLNNLTQTSSSDDIIASDNDPSSESSEGELQYQDEEMPLDYASDDSGDEGNRGPEWNVLEEAAENEDSGDDEERSDSGPSSNDVR